MPLLGKNTERKQIAILLLGVFLLFYCTNTEQKIIATVGSHEIPLTKFKERFNKYLFSTGMKDNVNVRKTVLNSMISEILLFKYSDNKEIFDNEEYKKELEWLKKQAVLAYLKDQEVYSKISVTEDEMRIAFKRVNEKIAARHLFAETKEEADNLYKLLKMGVDFNILATQVFSDSVLKNNGGYLGYFTWGDMDPNFEEAAYSMNIGEISMPIKAEFGYSIIKLEDRISHPLLTEYEYTQRKSQIESTLRLKKKKPAETNYVNSIIEFDNVVIDQAVLKSIQENFDKTFPVKTSENFAQNSDDVVCARYKEKSYTKNQIINRVKNLPYYHRDKLTSLRNFEAVIKGFILQDALYVLAKNKGYDEIPVVQEKFQKMELNLFIRYKNQYITDNADISDSVVYRYYLDNLNFFSTHDEVNVQEIIVDDSDLADSLRSKIIEGENFGKIAEEYSIRKYSSENKGIIGLAPLSKFGILKQTFWTSSLNELIGPIEIEGYYGLFKVLEKRESKPIEFESVKREAAIAAKFSKQSEFFSEYVKNLKETISVKIDGDLLYSFKSREFSL